MTYNKPEVVKLDSAVTAIQGTTKPETDQYDFAILQPNAVSANAYESDE